MHLQQFVEQKLTDDDLDAAGGILARLATGKAQEILDEFDGIIFQDDPGES